MDEDPAKKMLTLCYTVPVLVMSLTAIIIGGSSLDKCNGKINLRHQNYKMTYECLKMHSIKPFHNFPNRPATDTLLPGYYGNNANSPAYPQAPLY